MCDLPKRRNVQIRRICSHTFSSNKGLWACWAKPWIQSAKQPKSLPFPTIEKTIDGTRKMRIIKIDTQVRAPLNSKSPGPSQHKPHQPVPQAQEPQQRRSHPLLWDALSGKWNVMWGDSLCFCLSIIDYDCKWFRWPPNSPLLFNPATIYSSWKNTQTQTHMQNTDGERKLLWGQVAISQELLCVDHFVCQDLKQQWPGLPIQGGFRASQICEASEKSKPKLESFHFMKRFLKWKGDESSAKLIQDWSNIFCNWLSNVSVQFPILYWFYCVK